MIGEWEAKEFGELIRKRRKALGMRQEDVVFATGVGRRYVIDLEAGKATAWLGPALVIAKLLDINLLAPEGPIELGTISNDEFPDLPELPELPPELPDEIPSDAEADHRKISTQKSSVSRPSQARAIRSLAEKLKSDRQSVGSFEHKEEHEIGDD